MLNHIRQELNPPALSFYKILGHSRYAKTSRLPLSIERRTELAELLVDDATGAWIPEQLWLARLQAVCDASLSDMEEVCAYVRRCKATNADLDLVVVLDSETLSAGTKIEHFTIVRLIDSGGMGAVYEAMFQVGDFEPRPVALKVIKSGVDNEKLARRLRAEQNLLSRLDHPNIVKAHFAGYTEAGDPYFSMELIRGALRLDRYCETHSLSISGRVEIFRKLCGVVDYVHSRNIAHRDLKPSNILMTEDGEPKVLDFGLAALIEKVPDAPSFVKSGSSAKQLGTPGRMSPQQEAGHPASIADDIFALGTILRDLTTDLNGADLAKAPQIKAVISRCLSPQAEQRFESAGELSRALAFLEIVPVKARVRPSRLAALTALAALVIVLGGWLSYRYSKERRDRDAQATKLNDEIRTEQKLTREQVAIYESIWSTLLGSVVSSKGTFSEREAAARSLVNKGDLRAKAILGGVYIGCRNIARQAEALASSNLPPSNETDFFGDIAKRVPKSAADTEKIRAESEETTKRVMKQAAYALLETCSMEKSNQGLDWWRELSEKNSNGVIPPALAELLAKGNAAVAKNPQEALKWAKVAAETGDADGLHTLGDLYFEGEAAPKDIERAITLWERAARAGSARAQFKIASIRNSGFGTTHPKNKQQAYVWALLAASNRTPRFFDIFNDPRDPNTAPQKVTLDAMALKQKLESELSPDEVLKAQRAAKELNRPSAPK